MDTETQVAGDSPSTADATPTPIQYLLCAACAGIGCSSCNQTGYELCENPGCHQPIPAVRAREGRPGRRLAHNVERKRFCSAKCRSYKFWLDRKAGVKAEAGA